jgi:hypothetical protein
MGLERVLHAAVENLSAGRRGFLWNNFGRLFAQDPPKGKVPQPFVSDEKIKELRSTYATELAAKTPEAALKLFDDAIKTSDDHATRYTLLMLARDLAADAYDMSLAFKATDKLDEVYADINAVGMKLKLFDEVRKRRKTPEQTEAVLMAGLDAAIAAVNKGIESKNKSFHDEAKTAAENAGRDAKSARNTYVSEKAEAIAKYAKELSGNGATGELALAKYQYFILNDDKAFAALDKIAEPKLKKLAGLTLMTTPQNPAPESYYELGDTAYDAAGETRVAFEKRTLHEKSLNLYRAALSSATGATKTKFERDKKLSGRIAELEKLTSIPGGNLVDLLKLSDPAKDVVSGNWKIQNGKLSAEAGARTKIEFPYTPPDEYDFRIVFTRTQGTNDVNQILYSPVGKTAFTWHMGGWDNMFAGFSTVKGVTGHANPTTSKTPLENGRKYEAIVKVRRDNISAYLDGKQIAQYKTNYGDIGQFSDWNLNKTQALGLGSAGNAVIFETIQVREINGRGKLLR